MYQPTHARKFRGYFEPEVPQHSRLTPAEHLDSQSVQDILEHQGLISSEDPEKPVTGDTPGLHTIRDKEVLQIGVIGRGASGAVYKVLHVPSGQFMAKKAIYHDTGAIAMKQVTRELSVMKQCDSPYITKYYGAYKEDSTVSLFTEYMNLGSLDRLLKKSGPFPENVVRYVNASVVNALVYLKGINVTHRDIKPSNILLNKDGEIKVCDFGVCGVLVDSVAMSFLGSSHHMAPERLTGSKYTDTGDVWSLGITLIELLQGQLPSSLPTLGPAFSVLQAAQQQKPPKLPETFTPDIVSYVEKCLTVDPQERISVSQLPKEPVYRAVSTADKTDIIKWIRTVKRKQQ